MYCLPEYGCVVYVFPPHIVCVSIMSEVISAFSVISEGSQLLNFMILFCCDMFR